MDHLFGAVMVFFRPLLSIFFFKPGSRNKDEMNSTVGCIDHRTHVSLWQRNMTVSQREGSKNRKSQVKGCLQAKAAPSAGGGGVVDVGFLMEPLILCQWRAHPVGNSDTARGQVFARYLSHFSDLKAFNQLCKGACQSCQTMSSSPYRHSKRGQREGKSSK